MKKVLLLPVMLMSLAAIALPNGWVVTVFNQAYTNLSSPIVVPLAAGWDDPDVTIPLGFTHTYAGKSTNTMYIDGSNISTGAEVSTGLTGTVNVYGWGIDIMDRAKYTQNPPSTISYKTDGVAGSQIAKIQWENVGFYGEDASVNTLHDSANVQLWLYEADGSFEFRFGSSYLDDFERDVVGTEMAIGLGTNLDLVGFSFDWFYYLSSLVPASVDSFDINNIPQNDVGIATYPVDGTVIRFGAVAVSTNNVVKLNDELTFYPTLVTNAVNLDFANAIHGNAMLRVLDMSGQVVLQQAVHNQKNKINVGQLAASNYLLQVQYNGQSVFYKFAKN